MGAATVVSLARHFCRNSDDEALAAVRTPAGLRATVAVFYFAATTGEWWSLCRAADDER